MVKRALTLLTSILIALSLLMPFNIYADQLQQSEIVGVSWNLIDTDISLSSGGNWYTYTYELEVKLKNKYVGIVDGTLSYTYSSVQNSSSTPTSKTDTTTKRNYVNGDSFKFNVYISNIGQQFVGNGPMYNCSYLINNSTTNVTKYEDLNSIESVVTVLSDIYQNSEDIEGLSNNQLEELENIVSNTSLSNQYLEIISKYRQYNLPLEFYNSVSYLLNKYEPIYINQYYEFNIPIFDVAPGEQITNSINIQKKGYDSSKLVFVLLSDFRLFDNSWQENVTPSYELETVKFEERMLGDYYLYTITASASYTDGTHPILFTLNANRRTKLCVLFFNNWRLSSQYLGISTDVALLTNLPNKLLYDLDIIANGTTASQSAVQLTDSTNSQLQTESNTLFQQENGFKSDMQNAMQNVNNTFRLQDMGTKFVSSAQWVRTQYEQLTNNTPFASLITFSLITGLALILLGKVYK